MKGLIPSFPTKSGKSSGFLPMGMPMGMPGMPGMGMPGMPGMGMPMMPGMGNMPGDGSLNSQFLRMTPMGQFSNKDLAGIGANPWSPDSMRWLQPIASYNWSKNAPWEPQQPYLTDLFRRASSLVGSWPNPLISEGTAKQEAGIRGIEGLLPSLTGTALAQYRQAGGTLDATSPALGFMLNPAILSPDSNPHLAATGEAAVRPLYQNLLEQILPAIRSTGVATGGYGGTRQAIAEGLAARGTQQAAADALARLYSTGYGQGLNAMSGAIPSAAGIASGYSSLAGGAGGFGSSLMGLNTLGGQALSALGGQMYMGPWNELGLYKNLISGNYGGTEQGVKTDPGYKVGESLVNTFMGNFGGMLGGGMMCWVAEELYRDTGKARRIRTFLIPWLGKKGPLGDFARHYQASGRRWAQMVRESPEARAEARVIWDKLYEMAAS